MSSSLEVEKLKQIDAKTQKIVFGFIHDAQKLLPDSKHNAYFIVPDLICYITLEFYSIPFRFDISNKGDSAIEADGKLFNTTPYVSTTDVSVGDSNGRKSGECMIKINKTAFSGIGITSNVNNIKHNDWLGNYAIGSTYYLHNSGHAWSVKAPYSIGPKQAFKCIAWKDGDIIKVEWNADGMLTYYINDSKVGEISIEKGLTYFFCAATVSHTQTELEIV